MTPATIRPRTVPETIRDATGSLAAAGNFAYHLSRRADADQDTRSTARTVSALINEARHLLIAEYGRVAGEIDNEGKQGGRT